MNSRTSPKTPLTGRKGVYTRKRGLDKETNKALLVKHISDNNKEGSRFRDLRQVLPSLSEDQIKSLTKELKSEGRIFCTRKTRAGVWHIRKDKVYLNNGSNSGPNKT